MKTIALMLMLIPASSYAQTTKFVASELKLVSERLDDHEDRIAALEAELAQYLIATKAAPVMPEKIAPEPEEPQAERMVMKRVCANGRCSYVKVPASEVDESPARRIAFWNNRTYSSARSGCNCVMCQSIRTQLGQRPTVTRTSTVYRSRSGWYLGKLLGR